MSLLNWNRLNIIQKIYIKEYALRRFNIRYHTLIPNTFSALNELQINWILNDFLPSDKPNKK